MAVTALRCESRQNPASANESVRIHVCIVAVLVLAAGSAGCDSVKTAKVVTPQPTVVAAGPKPADAVEDVANPVESNPYVSQPKVQTAQANRVKPGGGFQKLGKPYHMAGRLYVPKRMADYDVTGVASWYGKQFHGRLTANGERFDMNAIMAAHPTMPLPSYARVTNLENGKSIIVRVNDRGPYAHNRLIDVSRRAATILDFRHKGTAKVRVQYIGDAPLHGRDEQFIVASYQGTGPAPKARSTDPIAALIALAKPPAPRPGVAFSGDLSAARLDASAVNAGTPFDPFLSIRKVRATVDRSPAPPTEVMSYTATARVSDAFDAIDAIDILIN